MILGIHKITLLEVTMLREIKMEEDLFYHDQHHLDDHDNNFTGGFEDTKITTASPSKNHLHKLQLEEMNPDLVPVFHQGNMMSRNRMDNSQNDLFNPNHNNNDTNNFERESPQDDSQPTIDNQEPIIIQNNHFNAQVTEDLSLISQRNIDKQLNNYLQQANVLSNHPHTLSSQRSPIRTQTQQIKSSEKKPNKQQKNDRSSTDKEYSSGSYYAAGPGGQHSNNNYGQSFQHISQQSSACKQHSLDSSQASSRIMFNAAQCQTSNYVDHQTTTIPDLMPISTQNKDSKTPGQSFYKTLGKTSARHKRTTTGAFAIKKDKIIPFQSKAQIQQIQQQQVSQVPQTRNMKASFGLENSNISYQTVQAPRSIRASMASKSDSLKSSSQKSTPLKRGQRASPSQCQQIIDQLENNVIIEDQQEQNQDFDQTLEEIKRDSFEGQKSQITKQETYQQNRGLSAKHDFLSKACQSLNYWSFALESLQTAHFISIINYKQSLKLLEFDKLNKKTVAHAQNTANLYSTRNSNLQKRNTQISHSPQTRDQISDKAPIQNLKLSQNLKYQPVSHSKRLSYGNAGQINQRPNASPLRPTPQHKSINQLEEDSIKLAEGHFKRLSMGSPSDYFKMQNHSNMQLVNANLDLINNSSSCQNANNNNNKKKFTINSLNSGSKYNSNISQNSNNQSNSNKYSSVIQQNFKIKKQL
eukprot:403364629